MRLTNEQLETMMTREEFQQWLLNRINMRMARAEIPPGVKLYSLGEWIYGIEQSGILNYLDHDLSEEDIGGELASIMASLEGGT